MASDLKAVEDLLDPITRERIAMAVEKMAAAKERGGKVVVVTGSGPNVHEGVTTLVAELMRAGIVDGVTTSSAVIAHEMGGVLDRVKRVDGLELGINKTLLPHGATFEMTLLVEDLIVEIAEMMPVDRELIAQIKKMPGDTIIKAAGNLGYPMGLYIERLAAEILAFARVRGCTFEETAGLGADPRTMMGVGALLNLPVLVTIPQLVGGGAVGLAIGDSVSTTERAARLARMLESADVIVESAVALTQEIHDGPLERYTGHGLWAAWQGLPTFSLEGKTLVRIDLDPALERVWQAQQSNCAVQEAVDKGLPKTKLFNVPFRMEMSGFARLEGSIPITGDIGAVWPVMAHQLAQRLGIELDFMSYPQQSPPGQAMREWIVASIAPLSRHNMIEAAKSPR